MWQDLLLQSRYNGAGLDAPRLALSLVLDKGQPYSIPVASKCMPNYLKENSSPHHFSHILHSC